MHAAFRVDASQAIGLGHMRRCLSLAHALAAIGVRVSFVTSRASEPLARPARSAGFAIHVIDPDAGDAAATVSALAAHRLDLVVADSYAIGGDWHEAVAAGLGCRLAAIDDVADRIFRVDVLIDQNLSADHRAKYAGRLSTRARLLGGPRFALLAPAFQAAAPIAIADRVRSVGVFAGGFDQMGLAATALTALRDAGFAGPVEIVASRADGRWDQLVQACAADGSASLTSDLPDLADFFARHDMQVGAGGSATWERCCLGVPSVLAIVADNQRVVVPALAELGAVAASEPTRAALTAAIGPVLRNVELRQDLAKKARALVDGRGAERVALALAAPRLALCPATMADADLMFAWRNDPATRAVSRDRGELEWGAHRAWLDAGLARPDRRIFVGRIGTRPVGVIRFDTIDSESVEVSLYLDPQLHGLGLGARLLAEGEKAAATGLDIVAEVLEGNRGSARLFESSGYSRTRPGHYRKPGRRR